MKFPIRYLSAITVVEPADRHQVLNPKLLMFLEAVALGRASDASPLALVGV